MCGLRLAFRERDELTSQMAAMKSRYEQTRQKEEDAYQQVKHAVDMVEHAQLEQTQVRQPPEPAANEARTREKQHCSSFLRCSGH